MQLLYVNVECMSQPLSTIYINTYVYYSMCCNAVIYVICMIKLLLMPTDLLMSSSLKLPEFNHHVGSLQYSKTGKQSKY